VNGDATRLENGRRIVKEMVEDKLAEHNNYETSFNTVRFIHVTAASHYCYWYYYIYWILILDD
jgi:hypothetical protein